MSCHSGRRNDCIFEESQRMDEDTGLIEVDMFPSEINNLDHPEVLQFRELLEDVALANHCRLLFFDIENGIVNFSFDSDKLMANILKIFQNDS